MKTFEQALKELEEKLKTLDKSKLDQGKVTQILKDVSDYITERKNYYKEEKNGIKVTFLERRKRDELLKKQAELMKALTSSDMPEALDDEIDCLGGLLIQDMHMLTPKDNEGICDTKQLGKESAADVNDATINYYGRKIRRITSSFPKGLADEGRSKGYLKGIPSYMAEGGVSTCKNADEFRNKFLPKLIDNSPWREAAVNGCIHLAFSKNYVDRVIVSDGMKARSLRLACFFATASREECANLVRSCTVLGDDRVSVTDFDNAVNKLGFGSKGYESNRDHADTVQIMRNKLQRRGYEVEDDEKLGGFHRNGLVGLKFHVFSLFPTFLNLSVQDYLRQDSQDPYFFEKRQKDRTSPYGLLANLTIWDQLNQKVRQWDNNKLFSSESPCNENLSKLLEDMSKLVNMRQPLMERFKNVPVWVRLPKEYKEEPVTAKDCVTPRTEMDQMIQMNKKLVEDVDALLLVLPNDKMLSTEQKKEIQNVLADIKSLAKAGSKQSEREISCQNKFEGNYRNQIRYDDYLTGGYHSAYPSRKQNYAQRNSLYYGNSYHKNENRNRKEYGNYNPKAYNPKYESYENSSYGYQQAGYNRQNNGYRPYNKKGNDYGKGYGYNSGYRKGFGYGGNYDRNRRDAKFDEDPKFSNKVRSREESLESDRRQIGLNGNAQIYVPTKSRGQADPRINQYFSQFSQPVESRFKTLFQENEQKDAPGINNRSFGKK